MTKGLTLKARCNLAGREVSAPGTPDDPCWGGPGWGREWAVLATPRQGGLCQGGWGSPHPGRGTEAAGWILLCSKTVGRFSLEIFRGQMEQVSLPGRRFPQGGWMLINM